MVKILAALSILNSSGASPGATKKVAALVVAALVTALVISTNTVYVYFVNFKIIQRLKHILQ